ncbi:MAG: hypothetical protein QOF37_2364 [Thermoleophilaceae bacterium]|nr:hypothetical protein [Thermoleophilaceae bacterium]
MASTRSQKLGFSPSGKAPASRWGGSDKQFITLQWCGDPEDGPVQREALAGGTAAPRPRLIGRDAECARLDELIAGAASGSGGALRVHGEAGVGKSALLDRVRHSAGSFEVIATVGVEAESELPFAALADVLSPFDRYSRELPGPQSAALRSALRLANEAATDRFAVYAGARGVLERAARERPVLVLVDDAQWIDAASREALLFVARRADETGLAVIFANRDGVGADLGDAGLADMALTGLPERAGVELIASAAPAVTPRVARQLQIATAGNPLALVEIATRLTPEQAAGREPLADPLPVGPRIAGLFAEPVRRLPEETRQALLVAAASETGRMDIILPALREAGIPPDALRRAELERLVEIGSGTLAFRHPLVRSAVYHAAPAETRRSAHRALAHAAREDTLADHRAWHLAAAAEAPDESVAAQLERVAERAERSGGTAVVARALEAAAHLTPAPGERMRRLALAAEASILTGDTRHAHALLDEAAENTDDRRALAHVERLRARSDILIGVPQSAHDRLLRAAEPWVADDPGLASELLSEAVVADMAQGGRDQYIRTAERALEAARRAGPQAEPLPGVLLAMGLVAGGDTAPGVDLLDRYSVIAQSPDVWRAAPEIVGMVGLTWIWLERFAEAEALLTAVTANARRDGAMRELAFPLAVLAELNFRLGRWPLASAMGEEAVRLAEDLGGGAILANNVAYLARFQAAHGRSEAARASAERALALCQAHNLQAIAPHALCGLGVVGLATRDYDGAVRSLTAIDELDAFSHEPGLTVWEPDLIEALVRSGDRARAEQRLEEYQADVVATGRPRGRAMAGRLRGLVGGDGQLDDAFGEALHWHDQTQFPFEEARTRLAYGERLRRARRRADAREQLGAALTTFEQLGAAQFAEQARGELRAAGVRDEVTTGGDPWALLTVQEARVAEAILGGATYREAAELMFLSPRTVEHHLRQVYRKLGVRSRSELPLRLTRR